MLQLTNRALSLTSLQDHFSEILTAPGKAVFAFQIEVEFSVSSPAITTSTFVDDNGRTVTIEEGPEIPFLTFRRVLGGIGDSRNLPSDPTERRTALIAYLEEKIANPSDSTSSESLEKQKRELETATEDEISLIDGLQASKLFIETLESCETKVEETLRNSDLKVRTVSISFFYRNLLESSSYRETLRWGVEKGLSTSSVSIPSTQLITS